MKITIEIWQSEFNSEWNCDLSIKDGGFDETVYWAVSDFSQLLSLIENRFEKAQIFALDESKIS